MISKIRRTDPYKDIQKLIFVVHDGVYHNGFGQIILNKLGSISFKLTEEEKELSLDEIEVIDEFMKMVYRIENNDDLDTLRETYHYYGNRSKQTQSTNKTS